MTNCWRRAGSTPACGPRSSGTRSTPRRAVWSGRAPAALRRFGASCCYLGESVITKDLCTYSMIFLHQEKILRDHEDAGPERGRSGLVDGGEGGALEEGAAVYGVDAAGHEAGGVAGQQEGQASDLGWVAHPAERDDGLPHFLGCG